MVSTTMDISFKPTLKLNPSGKQILNQMTL